ncbi:MAG: hypothetical protein V1790_18360 [Planctomycetota bacterium]
MKGRWNTVSRGRIGSSRRAGSNDIVSLPLPALIERDGTKPAFTAELRNLG